MFKGVVPPLTFITYSAMINVCSLAIRPLGPPAIMRTGIPLLNGVQVACEYSTRLSSTVSYTLNAVTVGTHNLRFIHMDNSRPRSHDK